MAGHRPTSLHSNLTAFALYNHACCSIEILIKLLTFLFNGYKRFFFNTFVTFYVFNVFFNFNMNVFYVYGIQDMKTMLN